ncbi:MAG: FKBP-type peptidyl-prolyl cis-trans isomerase [Actinomycetes bacterium]
MSKKLSLRTAGLGLSLIACLTLTLAGCANDSQASRGGGATLDAEPQPTTSATKAGAAAFPKVTGGFGENPTISQPTGKAPTTLQTKDLVVGKGEKVTDITKSYSWNYEGVNWSNGKVFDSSFERGAPIPFALNQVIPGWTEGLKGIKVGGRRVLLIPADLAYGEAGSPPAIGPNEPLVFVVDLVGPAS